MRQEILMCAPDYFTLDYVINPWMAGHEGSLDIELARAQWTELRDALVEYADIVEMEPAQNLPDMVFTANAGVVYGIKAITSHFMPMSVDRKKHILKSGFPKMALIFSVWTKKLVSRGQAIASDIEVAPRNV
jgi:N-dimethylarginine dimethylaminohydrolase